ncbi:MAG: hypothetical protein MN733_41295, partial [Nitrososphaera sp.]|nr:hypothetical protein [Nitrososphaera sp.]
GGTTTGLRLLNDIRKEYDDIPIIIVSIKRRTLAPGLLSMLSTYKVSDYLEKPISAGELASAIKRTVASKRSMV